MNNINQSDAEQPDEPPDGLHDTPGMMLRNARESANITYAAVSEALHLTVHYIKALENDDYGKLPGATFVKGYLRAYARFLKVDVSAVLASYEENNVSAEELTSRTESLSRNRKRHDQTFRWAVVTAVIIVVGVAAGWWFVGKDQLASTAATAPQNTSQQQTDRSPVPTTAANQSSSDQVSGTDVPAFTTSLSSTQGIASRVSDPGNPTLGSSPAQGAADGFNQSQGATGTAASAILATRQLSPEGTVNNQAAAALAMAEPLSPAISSGTEDVAMTITPTTDGARQVTLVSSGTDILQLYFKGVSWIEIDDGAKGRLFNDTLSGGDAMTLHGTAPFNVLLGDATQVELSYNSEPVNLSSHIRNDKTARFAVGAAVVSAANGMTSQGANP